MLISPAERPPLSLLGPASSEVEARGVDFLLIARAGGLIGIQRKEVKDLVASIRGRDDRFARELGQIKDGDLAQAWLLIEGDWRWTSSGESLTVPGFLRAQYDGVMMAVQVEYGVKVITTASVNQTYETLQHMENWYAKATHGSLQTRSKSRAITQTNRSREWCVHVLQSFKGLAGGRAQKFYDHFGHLPLTWTVSREEMMQVPGIGKKIATELDEALAYVEPAREEAS